MKRALKKREKAVLNNTPSSDDALVEHLEHLNIVVNPKVNRRVRTKAAMIGLAISMGATSLLVTRQSDQAQAAAPVGSQKATSTIPAASDTTVKFASTSLETQTVLPASLPENSVIVEPTAISQLPGLEAKRNVTASGVSVQVPILTPESHKIAANNSSFNLQPPVSQGLSTQIKANETVQELSNADSVTNETDEATAYLTGEPQPQAAENTDASGEINAQLKAQQEFALNRLQAKSNRLRNSLAESRSEETQTLSKNDIALTQPTTIETAPEISANKTAVEKSSTFNNNNTQSLVSRLQETKETSESNPQAVTIPVPPIGQVVALSGNKGYEVQPGDTLAAIASRFNTSVSEIVRANSLSNPDQLKISQKLIIPVNQVNHSRAIQVPVVVNSQSAYSTTTPQLTHYPVNTASIQPNLPVVTSQAVSANNNSVTIPVPVTANQQIQVNQPTTVVATETESTSLNVQGLGGDTPVPTIFAEMKQAQRLAGQTANTKENQGVRALRSDIQRLREKHSNQQSGNAIRPAATEGEKAAVPIPVTQTSSLHTEIQRLQEKYRNQQSGNTTIATTTEREPASVPPLFAQTNSPEAEIQRLRQQFRSQQSGNANSPVVIQREPAAVQTPVAQTNSPEAEIQRLREQYRQQQSRNTSSPSTTEREQASIPIPVVKPNNATASQPAAGQRNASIPIHVPSLSLPNSGSQFPNSQTRTRRANEPINPEFASSRNGSNQRIAASPSGANISDTLGNLRGSSVTPQIRPQLPPLAAVEHHLPRPIDATTPPPSTASTTFIWPAKGVLTSGYGRRWGRMHRGIDIANATGTPIYAAADGVVETSGWNRGGFGILVDIRHPDGTLTRYAHNNRTLVRVGQQVTQGQQIAEMGSTGFSTGPHTHFEIHPPGRGAIDPIALLPKER